MAKSRRHRSRRGGSGMIAIGGKSRRRRGGQYTGYASPPQSTASGSGSSLISDIGSGISNVWQSTKKAVGSLGNTITGSSSPAPAAGYGGRRKRRGGSTVVPTKGVFGSSAAKVGGSRRKRRGGQPVGYSGTFGANASPAKGGSRRRRKH